MSVVQEDVLAVRIACLLVFLIIGLQIILRPHALQSRAICAGPTVSGLPARPSLLNVFLIAGRAAG
jgi:hypothetical protein